MDVKFAERLAATDARLQQVAAQQAKGQAENLTAIRQEVRALDGKTLWRRIIASKIVGGITIAVCWVIGSYWLINTQIGVLRDSVDQLKADQVETLSTLSDDPQGIVDFTSASLRVAEKSNETSATLAGIAAILSTPDGTIGMRDGKLTLKLKTDYITIKQVGEYTLLRIHEEMPPIFGRIEDHLNEADKALQENQK
jgi:hypothetical protein